MCKLSSRLVVCGGLLHAGRGPHHTLLPSYIFVVFFILLLKPLTSITLSNFNRFCNRPDHLSRFSSFAREQITSYRTYNVKMSATSTILNQFDPNDINSPPSEYIIGGGGSQRTASSLSRYETQKRRDWNIFGQYLRNHKPPLVLSRCSGAHILEFLRYLDQFGKTKVHNTTCLFFGHPHPPAPCPCPLKQAWGSLDALVGRLRAAFEENGGTQEANPFGARAVRLYLREVRYSQAKARGIAYEKKKRKRPQKQVDHHAQWRYNDHGGGITTCRQEFRQQ